MTTLEEAMAECNHGAAGFYDIARAGWKMQHGPSPEHQLFIPDTDLVRARRADYGVRRAIRWLREVHRYEARLIQ